MPTVNVPWLCVALLAITLTSSAPASPIEDDVDVEINRLESKYTGNKTMILALARLRRSWRDHQGALCFFEKTVAGGAVNKPDPPEAGKAYQACVDRTRAEMKAALAKY